MRRLRPFIAMVVFGVAACRPAAIPQPAVTGPTPRERLSAADALVAAGCLDCLTAAFHQYSDLIAENGVTAIAAESATRTALLIAVRENEIGLVSGGYLERARQLAGESPSPLETTLLEVGDVLASIPAGSASSPSTERETRAFLQLSRRQDDWLASLRLHVPADRVASYFWLALACGSTRGPRLSSEERAAVLGADAEVPLLAVKSESSCVSPDHDRIQAVLDRDPRFAELHAVLGSIALRGMLPKGGLPDFDETDAEYRSAYAWRQDWPVLTSAIANLALASEDFERALEFFGQTLVLVPADPAARLGVVRALTYLTRYVDAIKAADMLLAETETPGEARYWRAFNELRLGRNNEAWEDVELAAHGLVNADVPKLAGLIAINRSEFVIARQRLELARSRRPDCDTGYFLQSVLAEMKTWEDTVRVAAETATCFDSANRTLQRQLTVVRESQLPAVRRERQVSRLEQQLTTNVRMQTTAWFNAAVGSFNLARKAEAERFAAPLINDDYFGERARALIDRIKGQ